MPSSRYGLRSSELIIRLHSILCGDLAIKSIDEPFVTDDDDTEEWAI